MLGVLGADGPSAPAESPALAPLSRSSSLRRPRARAPTRLRGRQQHTPTMSHCSTAQEAFLQQARALVQDLGSFASPADYETQSRLDHLLRVVDSTYMDWLPLERDAVIDALLALLCETCAHGSLDLVSSVRPFRGSLSLQPASDSVPSLQASAVSLWSSLAVATPPEQVRPPPPPPRPSPSRLCRPDVHGLTVSSLPQPVVNIPHVWRHISDKVTWLARPYKSGIANWRRDFKNAVSPDKLRRLDVHAQGILVECFDKRTQGLWVSGRPGTVLPRLPSFVRLSPSPPLDQS